MHISSKDPMTVFRAVNWFVGGELSAYESHEGDRIFIQKVEFCDNCGSEVNGANAVSIEKRVAERILDLLEIENVYKGTLPEIVPTEQGYCCTDCWEN